MATDSMKSLEEVRVARTKLQARGLQNVDIEVLEYIISTMICDVHDQIMKTMNITTLNEESLARIGSEDIAMRTALSFSETYDVDEVLGAIIYEFSTAYTTFIVEELRKALKNRV